MPPRPTLHRYPSTSSPTYTPCPCPFAGCTLSIATSHTHYYPAIYDSSVEPGACPWPNCPQVLIHSHRYNPSGTNHTLPPPPPSFSITAYLLTHPELKAQLDADAARGRQETRLRLEQMAIREKQKEKAQAQGRKGKSARERPYIFRDPSWSGEPEEHDEGGAESWGMAVLVEAGKGDEGGDRDGDEGRMEMYRFRPVARPRLLERRHTLAGMQVVDDI